MDTLYQRSVCRYKIDNFLFGIISPLMRMRSRKSPEVRRGVESDLCILRLEVWQPIGAM